MANNNKSILKTAKSSIRVTEFLDYKEYLDAVYKWMKNTVSKYSYRKYSEDLGFSKTNVIGLIIQGRRPLTVKASLRIVNALELTGLERNYFEKLVAFQNARIPSQREELFKGLVALKADSLQSLISKERLAFYTEWYHSAIFEMLSISNIVQTDPAWIASRLKPRIRPEQVRKSLELLESLGVIKIDPATGCYIPIESRVTTGDEISSIALIRYHQKFIELAKESITHVDKKKRDISSITISVPEELIPQVKAEISYFRKKLLALSDDSKDPNSVYQLNIQLFPLFTLEEKDEE